MPEVTTWRERLAAAARTALPGTTLERGAFFVLLGLAAVLRCWDLPHIPYTHDEISALIRLYPSLGETIGKGVVALDTHPPGVQVFEWCWTRLFGLGEPAVKLPFILMALAALFLLYRFTYAWCGGSVALIVLALLATLQYTVMYGQIARPYAAGLFTTALLADQLTRHLGRGSRRTLIGVAVGAVLSAYTHHFALMLAAFMYVTGLVLLKPGARRGYLVAGGIAAALYLPNLPIIAKQFGWKGLDEWLTAPGPLWTLDYAWWIAHCSLWMAAVLVLLLVGSAGLRIRFRGTIAPLWAIALCWGLAPLAIGTAYSLWRAPVLQYSVLLFSFPYVLLGALAGLRHLKGAWAVPVACATAAISVITLVGVRKHYETFYRSKYEAIAQGVVNAAQVPGRLAVIDAPERMVRFYLRHWNVDSAAAPFLDVTGQGAGILDSLAGVERITSVFYGAGAGAGPENVGRLQAAFPFLAERHDRVEGQTFLFQAMPSPARIDDIAYRSLATPEAVGGRGWKVDADIPLFRDTTGRYGTAPAQWDFTGREFGALFEAPLYDLGTADNDVVEARMDVGDVDREGEVQLVMELKDGERTVFYRNHRLSGTGSTVIVALKLADLPGHGRGLRLRSYLWNSGKRHAHVSALEVHVRSGNPWLYGLVEPLKGPLRYP